MAHAGAAGVDVTQSEHLSGSANVVVAPITRYHGGTVGVGPCKLTHMHLFCGMESGAILRLQQYRTMMIRRKLLITGAAGGMGRACARLLGSVHDLVLTDVQASSLDRFAEELSTDGYEVTGAHAGDLGNAALLSDLTRHLSGGAPFALIHTAGLSPSMATWRQIMAVNLIATEKLIRAIEPSLSPGSVAVLIASVAGHVSVPHPDLPAALDDPLADGFMERIGALMDQLAGGQPAVASGLGYVLSKQAVLRIVERRAAAWGAKGTRIVSISPGMISTPMGRRELAESSAAAQLADATPAGRIGNAMDIAMAARFLISDAASFITGSDLAVDGGSLATTRIGTTDA